MDVSQFGIFEDKNVSASEFANLMDSVGWGSEGDYDATLIERSLTTYPFVAHARDQAGRLVGYVSAFSDGAFSTFLGELVVRPEAQRLGLGTELLKRVEQRYSGIPVYVHAFADAEEFFRLSGYRVSERPMQVLFKIPA